MVARDDRKGKLARELPFARAQFSFVGLAGPARSAREYRKPLHLEAPIVQGLDFYLNQTEDSGLYY